MTSIIATIRLMLRKTFGSDKDVAKRELFDPDRDDYLRYLRDVRKETRENAMSAALLERGRE